MSFSVFSPAPAFQKAEFTGNQPAAACDYF